MGSHREFTKPQVSTTGVQLQIHQTPRVHHWGPIKNLQNPKGAPLVSHCEFTKSKGAQLGSHREFTNPQRHHWGPTANSLNPKGAPLGSNCEFTKTLGCTIWVPLRIHKTPRVHHWGPLRIKKPQGCTNGFPPRIHKTPMVHHWGPTANSQNPKGAPLGSHREFTKP